MNGLRPRTPRIAAVVLAGGASARMDGKNKLLAALDGEAVVRHVVAAARASQADPVVVVLGHGATDVRAVFDPEVAMNVQLVENPAHDAGLASSVVAGVRALPPEAEGCVILLGDMPFVRAEDVDALITAFDANAASVPTVDGQRGNPVLWPRAFFAELLDLEGDRGARRLLESRGTPVVEVPLDNAGLLLDIDTPEDLKRARSAAPFVEMDGGGQRKVLRSPRPGRGDVPPSTEDSAPCRR